MKKEISEAQTRVANSFSCEGEAVVYVVSHLLEMSSQMITLLEDLCNWDKGQEANHISEPKRRCPRCGESNGKAICCMRQNKPTDEFSDFKVITTFTFEWDGKNLTFRGLESTHKGQLWKVPKVTDMDFDDVRLIPENIEFKWIQFFKKYQSNIEIPLKTC